MDLYYDIALKLILGFLCLIAQINLTGKGNLAPSSAIDSVQNFVLGGIIGGAMFNTAITLLQFFLVLIIWTLLVLITKFLTNHNRFIKIVVDGRPRIVIKDGQIQLDEVMRQGISASDLMFKLRQSGVYSTKSVRRAMIEQNGQLTISLVGDENVKLPLITDRQVNLDTLQIIGKTEEWLARELLDKKIQLTDVYLAEYIDGKIEITKY